MGGRGGGAATRELRPGVTVGGAAARQAAIDQAKPVAAVAGQVYEAVGNEASPRAMQSIVTNLGNRYGVDVTDLHPHVDNPGGMLDAVDRMTERAGLTRNGLPGARAAFDRSVHRDFIAGAPRSGEVVETVRPGYTLTLPGGERVGVANAIYEAVRPSEPVAMVMPARP